METDSKWKIANGNEKVQIIGTVILRRIAPAYSIYT